MQTERQWRENEQLRYISDYYDALEEAREFASNISNNAVAVKASEKVINIFYKALQQKAKYIVKSSSKWRKKQSIFSKIADIKKERKELKKENDKTRAYIKELEFRIERLTSLISNNNNNSAESTEQADETEQSEQLTGEVLTELEEPKVDVIENSDDDDGSLLVF
mgnify:CR=1 FL=1